MKKIIFFLLCSFSLQAQQAGIRSGVAFSNLTNTSFLGFTGYYAAVTGHVKSKSLYSFQPEIGIMRLGAKGSASGYNGLSTQKIVADYVFLNIMNKFSPHPSFGFLIGPGFEQEVSNSPFLRKQSSVAINFGLAVSLPAGFGLEVRARRGLRDLYNGARANAVDSNDLPIGENSFLSFQAGLFYHFSK